MNKRHLHHLWRQLRPVRWYYFLILAVLFAIVGAFAMRANNIKSVELFMQVQAADKQDGDVEAALRELRQHMYGHMNTQLDSLPGAIKPPIQLKYRYERLVKAEKDRVAAYNAGVMTEGQRQCGDNPPCVQQYVSSRTISEQVIPDGLYKFDFASPAWSPDLAGLSLLAAGVALLLAISRLMIDFWFRAKL